MNIFEKVVDFCVDEDDEMRVGQMKSAVALIGILIMGLSIVLLQFSLAILISAATFILAIKLLGDIRVYERELHLDELRRKFEVALNGSDKSEALKSGRAYYAAKRRRNLTIYDEQALANDIATMDN